MASRIFSDFEENKFKSSSKLMEKLLEKRNDIKVSFNHSVIEYRKSGCTLTDEFLMCLQNIQLRIDAEHSANNLQNPEVDFCTLHYNHAIMLLLIKQPSTALQILAKLKPVINQINQVKENEKVVRQMLYLMMEVLLENFKPEECLKLIETHKTLLNISNNDSHLLTQYKIRCFLLSNSPPSKIAKLFNFLPNNEALSIGMLKAEWEMRVGETGACLNTLQSITPPPNNTTTTPSTTSIKPTNSTTNLSTIPTSTTPKFLLQVYNNTALLHFSCHRYHTALSFLSRALTEAKKINVVVPHNTFSTATSLSGRPLEDLSSHHHNLLHNTGVALLHCGKPAQAFDVLLGVVQVYPNNARLWLRLAECSVATYKQSTDPPKHYQAPKNIINTIIGSSKHRKVVLNCSRKQKSTNKFSSAIPMPTMEFASLCVKNALTCLRNVNHLSHLHHNKALGETKDHENRLFNTLAPSNPVSISEIENLKRSALALSAYLSLHHHDYHQALHNSTLLLCMPSLPGLYRYLGQTYKARALIGLDKLAECDDLLNSDLISDVDRLPGKEKLPKTPSAHTNLEESRAVMDFNKAVLCCIARKFLQAEVLLNKSLSHLPQPYPSNVYMLKVYLGIIQEKSKPGMKFNVFDVLK